MMRRHQRSLQAEANTLFDQVTEGLYHRSFDEEGGAVPGYLEGPILQLLLTSLMLRAERNGVDWPELQHSAEESCAFVRSRGGLKSNGEVNGT